MNITFKQSPNYSPGRSQAITKVVMHWMVGTLASTDAQFANSKSEVSAHYGIENNTIHQYVRDGDTAWHAKQANPYTIGIEHSAAPGRPATQETINTSARLLADICSRHNIPINRGNVIKHSEVVNTKCPGTIPIDEIISKAIAIQKGDDMPNAGDVHNAYLQANGRKATPEEVKVYTNKTWNAPDGLYYGKIYRDFENTQKALKEAQNSGDGKILPPGNYKVK